MTAPANLRAPIPPPPEPPRLVSDGRARRADSTRQPHDKWTFVLIPPGTGARPRTLHISVRRLRAIFAAVGAVGGVSVALTAVLGLVLSGAPRLEGEYKGVQLGILEAEPAWAALAPDAAGPLAAIPASPFGAANAPLSAPAAPAPVDSAPAVAAAPARRAPALVPAPVVRRRTRSVPRRAEPDVEVAEAGAGSFIGGLPVIGRITSNFSRARRHPLLGVVRRHKGIDIAAPSGTHITAPMAGRVTFAGRKVGFGLVVEVDHGGGVVTRYAHCRTLNVGAGRQVQAGDMIATVGRTGLATGPHLHYEVLVDGRSVDPLRTPLASLVARGPGAAGRVAAPDTPAPSPAPPADARVPVSGPAVTPDSVGGDTTAGPR